MMLDSQQLEELLCLVSALDLDELIRQFQAYQADFPVDFTPDFFRRHSLERLRHIFVALCIHCQRLPEIPEASVA